jgi:hypothetical protein
MDTIQVKRQGPIGWLSGRSRRFWILAVSLPVLYALSVGPFCWVSSRTGSTGGARIVNHVFRPLTWTVEKTHIVKLRDLVDWYSGLLAADGWFWAWTPWMQSGDAVWGRSDFLIKDLR